MSPISEAKNEMDSSAEFYKINYDGAVFVEANKSGRSGDLKQLGISYGIVSTTIASNLPSSRGRSNGGVQGFGVW